MKTIRILTMVLSTACVISASNLKANDKNNDPSLSISGAGTEQNDWTSVEHSRAAKRPQAIVVKNVWREMPGYDRYGNEITPRARLNMLINAELEKKNKNVAVNEPMEGASK